VQGGSCKIGYPAAYVDIQVRKHYYKLAMIKANYFINGASPSNVNKVL
jgi:hypothetical protein